MRHHLHVDIDKLRALAPELTTSELSTIFGVGRTTIKKRMIEHGIPGRKRGTKRILPPIEQLVAMLRAGRRQEEIATLYGVTRTAVHDALKRGGYSRVNGEYVRVPVPEKAA